MHKPKALFIVGPTATGKTDLALSLAEKFHGDLLSADSIQVYKGLDIISGKDVDGISFSSDGTISSPNDAFTIGYYQFPQIKLYGVDIVEPSYAFNVSDYIAVSEKILNSFIDPYILPIIVGGTGFYINALLYGYETLSIPADTILREQLSQKNISELIEILSELAPEKVLTMNKSDRNNPRRLIRAIEVFEYKKKNSSLQYRKKPLFSNSDVIIVGLRTDKSVLKERVEKRVLKRIANGALAEAERLYKNYESLSSQVQVANGYKQLFSYLNNEISFDEAVEKWKLAEYLNIKKQLTWFGKMKDIVWFDIGKSSFKNEIEEKASWLLKL